MARDIGRIMIMIAFTIMIMLCIPYNDDMLCFKLGQIMIMYLGHALYNDNDKHKYR